MLGKNGFRWNILCMVFVGSPNWRNPWFQYHIQYQKVFSGCTTAAVHLEICGWHNLPATYLMLCCCI